MQLTVQQSGHQRDGLGAVPARRYGEPDMAQGHACGKRVEFLLGAALGALGGLLPGDQPVVWAELSAFAEVRLANAVETHEGVNAGLRHLPEGVERTEAAVCQDDVAFFKMAMSCPKRMLSWTWMLLFAKSSRAPLASEKRPTTRIWGNPQPAVWDESAGISPGFGRVGHGDGDSIDHPDAPSEP